MTLQAAAQGLGVAIVPEMVVRQGHLTIPGGSLCVAHWLNFDPPLTHAFANGAKSAEGDVHRNCFTCVVDDL